MFKKTGIFVKLKITRFKTKYLPGTHQIMYILIAIVLIFIEIAVLAGLVKLLFLINDLNKKMPEIERQVLNEIVEIREELKIINKQFETKMVQPLSSKEIGNIIGNIVTKMIIFKRFSLSHILFTLFKYRDRIAATIPR